MATRFLRLDCSAFLQSFVHSAGSIIPIRLYPIQFIRGYVTSDFHEGDILKERVTYPVIFEENLIDLDDVTYWKIIYNRGSDSYRIERDYE